MEKKIAIQGVKGCFHEQAARLFYEEHGHIVPEIVECHFITGTYTAMVKLYCVDNEHLMRTIFDNILRIPGVTKTQTYISLNEAFSREPHIDYLDR